MVSNSLLAFAATNYGFEESTLRFESDSTNQIYFFKKDSKDYVLRFSSRPAEKIKETIAEMEWLDYLAQNGIGVGLPLKSQSDELVISTQEEGKNYIISAFSVVTGKGGQWNDQVFYNWGKLMGDIHRLTKDFKPSNDHIVRSTFDGRFALDDNVKSCPSVNVIVEDLIKEMLALPKDRDFYGLIHNDMHQRNFLVDGNKINVFDFDDSLYGWFALDIGIALYHAVWWGRKDDDGNDLTDRIIQHFLKGYLSANHLSNFWLAKIPMFMKFRHICAFSWFFDPNDIGEHTKAQIAAIENGILFTDCEIKASLFSNKVIQ